MTDTPNLATGEHASDFDPLPLCHLGSRRDAPFVNAPPDFDENGLPYGAWCLCHQCSMTGRSTFVFDFYGGAGEPLKCERCVMNDHFAKAK